MLHAYMVADRAHIAAALKVLDAHPGGVEGYFSDELGVTHADLVKLRALYTR